MTFRRIHNNGRRNIGKFPSLKMKRSIWYKSLLERDYIYHLEIDPDVFTYKENPLIVSFAMEGRLNSYSPDFLIERKVKRQLIEVISEREKKKEEFNLLVKCVSPICWEAGYEFLVATEKDIRAQPYLDNIKLLHKYSRIKITYEDQINAYSFFSKRKETTLEEVIKNLSFKWEAKQIVFALIYWGTLSVDLSKTINTKSIVRLGMPKV